MRVHAVGERKITYNHVMVVTKGLNVFVLFVLVVLFVCFLLEVVLSFDPVAREKS